VYSVKLKISIAVATIVIGFLVALLAAVTAVQIVDVRYNFSGESSDHPASEIEYSE